MLWPFARIYQLVTDLRNYLYDRKILKSASYEIPIISIGNLSMGGTGKTPHTEYLIHLLKYVYQVGTLSRGYGRRSHGFILADHSATAATIGDEPMLYRLKHHEVTVAVGEERSIAIPRMLQEGPPLDVILLDDAYQHRAVRPGLSILLTEYDRPYTRDDLLPAGWLRESRVHAHRADIIIVTKCPDTLSGIDKLKIRGEIQPRHYQHLYFSSIGYGELFPLFTRHDSSAPYDLRRADVILLTGIAHSENLMTHIREQSKNIYEVRYRDHHYFDEYDLEKIRDTYNSIDSTYKLIITTEKDAVRLLPHRAWFLANNISILVQPIRVIFSDEDGAAFDADILRYIETTRKKLLEQQ